MEESNTLFPKRGGIGLSNFAIYSSIVLGLMAWIFPVIAIKRMEKGQKTYNSLFFFASFIACALSLCMQILNTGILVQMQDFVSLSDTAMATLCAAIVLILVTIFTNLVAMNICDNNSK